MFLQPIGMPGLLQPPGPADPVQRLALMMVLMVLGMPPVYSCHTTTGCGLPLDAGMSEPRICPLVGSGKEIGISAVKEELDKRQWVRLPAYIAWLCNHLYASCVDRTARRGRSNMRSSDSLAECNQRGAGKP
jgi:hypothetical protein